jgi:hypothetical protein
MSARIRRIRPEEVPELHALAANDRHVVLAPTHVVVKDGEIVGYLSIGAVPVVHVWMDSGAVQARDSLAVLSQLDAVMDHAGAPVYLMPCAKDSPYLPHMERMDFRELWDTTLFIKEV